MRLIILGLVALWSSMAGAQELRIAAAADLAPSMPELKTAFERGHPGTHVVDSIGSSVNLRTQIENGAPFDIFLSADTEQPQRLTDEGKAQRADCFVYAQGQLVLLVPAKNAAIRSIEELAASEIRKIAIANPTRAPYGRAALTALRSAGIYDRIKDKIVEGENIAQAAQFVLSGNADAGLVSASAKSIAGADFRAYPVDPTLYPAIRQEAVLLHHTPAGDAFMAFLESAAAQTILQAHGLKSPQAILKPVGH